MRLAATLSQYLFNLITLIALLLVIHYGIDFAQGMERRLTTPFTMDSDFGLFYCGALQFFEHGLSPYSACAGYDTLSGFLYPPLSLLY